MNPVTSFSILCIVLSILAAFEISVTLSPPPVQCNPSGCTVTNYQGLWPDRAPCKAATVVYPRTEQELLAAVASGVRSKQKMKVVSKWSQSIPKFACPGGDSGLLISTRDLNRDIVVDPQSMTVTADAGVLLRNLLDAISELGYALPAATYWDAVSVAGAVATGAHGSSLWGRGSALHDHVVGISLVVPATEEEGFAKVVRLVEDSEEGDGLRLLDAAKLSVGVLGAISKVVFRVEPLFKRSVEFEVVGDDAIEDQVLRFGAEYEFGDICWHPSLKKALLKKDIRVPVDTPGEGVNRYRGFQAMHVSRVQQSRLTEERIEANRDTEHLCKLSEMILDSRVPSGNGFLNDGINFTGFPVVGFNNRMQTTSGCQDAGGAAATAAQPIITAIGLGYGETSCSGRQDREVIVDSEEICSWDFRFNGSLFHQTAFSVPLDKVQDFILDIKKLRDMDPSSMCGLSIYGGIYLRYVRESSAYLGQREDAVEFDITYYRSREFGTPRLNEDVFEEIEQMALFKYQGKPHWGKNRNIAFTSIKSGVRDLDRFILVKKKLDPEGLFSSKWSEAVMCDSDKIPALSDYCALEGLCICSEDRHCAPHARYFCRPGKVFEDARVCRYEGVASSPHKSHQMASRPIPTWHYSVAVNVDVSQVADPTWHYTCVAVHVAVSQRPEV